MNDSTQNECDKVLAPKYGLYEASKILILRIVATWLSLLILWTNTENGKAFFNTLAVFAISQLLYAVSIKAYSTVRQVYSTIVIIIVAVIGLIAVAGLIGVAALVSTDGGCVISLVKSTNQIPIWGSESFIYAIAIILPIAYAFEWGSSWFAKDDIAVERRE